MALKRRNDIEEAIDAVGVVLTNRDESDWDLRRNADSVLDIKALQIRMEEAVRIRGAK